MKQITKLLNRYSDLHFHTIACRDEWKKMEQWELFHSLSSLELVSCSISFDWDWMFNRPRYLVRYTHPFAYFEVRLFRRRGVRWTCDWCFSVSLSVFVLALFCPSLPFSFLVCRVCCCCVECGAGAEPIRPDGTRRRRHARRSNASRILSRKCVSFVAPAASRDRSFSIFLSGLDYMCLRFDGDSSIVPLISWRASMSREFIWRLYGNGKF